MSSRIWVVCVLPAVTLLMAGACGDRKPTPYSIALRNCTAEELNDAGVSFPGFRDDVGILAPGARKTRGFVDVGFPEEARVTWRGEDGVLREKTVAVRTALPADFGHDEIVFEICGHDELRIRPEPGPAQGSWTPGSWRDPQTIEKARCACQASSRR